MGLDILFVVVFIWFILFVVCFFYFDGDGGNFLMSCLVSVDVGVFDVEWVVGFFVVYWGCGVVLVLFEVLLDVCLMLLWFVIDYGWLCVVGVVFDELDVVCYSGLLVEVDLLVFNIEEVVIFGGIVVDCFFVEVVGVVLGVLFDFGSLV